MFQMPIHTRRQYGIPAMPVTC